MGTGVKLVVLGFFSGARFTIQAMHPLASHFLSKIGHALVFASSSVSIWLMSIPNKPANENERDPRWQFNLGLYGDG
jgi:hypothetical protein